MDLDEAAIRKAAGGDVEIVRMNAFVAFLSKSERVASLALEAAERHAHWENTRVGQPALSKPVALKAASVDRTME